MIAGMPIELPLGALSVEAPEGTAFEFLVLFLVVIVGPPLLERFRVPGLIGLLLGGFAIGAHGFGWIETGNTTIPDLGQLGLLYLMFVAGVELDLGLLRVHRRSAILFGIATFLVPMVLGTAAGAALGWGAPAALLLGSLLASHTLVLYPTIRNAGLAPNPIVASAVGATVLTDTLALIVLAGVSGSETGSGSSFEIALSIVLGLTVLFAFSFLVLPRLARLAFRLLGADRAIRYVIAVAAFLAAAVVAEMFEIEGIVGAFFAGLALNRLVPNRGPLMGRIDFFGNAVFVPIFLVSVGLLLNPSVMAEGKTLGLAALLIVACLGGKAIAAWSTEPLLGASRAEALAVFALSAPQAAATLAATTVGFNIGLFSESVVNAVLVLILVSVTLATLVADRAVRALPKPAPADRPLGEHVLVAVEEAGQASLALRAAARVAEPIGGAVEVVLLEPDDRPGNGDLAALERLCAQLGLEAEPIRLADSNLAEGVLHAARSFDASLVLAVEHSERAGEPVSGWAETVSGGSTAPVAIARGEIADVAQVRLLSPGGEETLAGAAAGVAKTIAEGLSRSELPTEAVSAREWVADLQPQTLSVVPLDSWTLLGGGVSDPPEGAAVLLVPEPAIPA